MNISLTVVNEYASQPPVTGVRGKVFRFVEHRYFHRTVLAVIVLSAVTLGLQTSEAVEKQIGGLLNFIDVSVVVFFVLEMTGRVWAHGGRFFRDAWSDFDLAVVVLSLISGPFAVLRALRALRLLRAIEFVPSMKRVVAGLHVALPGLLAVVPLLLLFMYVWAVMGTTFFGNALSGRFGTFGVSFYTLFQIMTFEGWSTIADELRAKYPVGAWFYLIPFIVITAFAVVNLFIAVMVDAMQRQLTLELEAVEGAVEAEQRVEEEIADNVLMLGEEVRALSGEVGELRTEVAAYQTSMFKRLAGMAALATVTVVVLRRPINGRSR
jgi:voltage-gated sodium channel